MLIDFFHIQVELNCIALKHLQILFKIILFYRIIHFYQQEVVIILWSVKYHNNRVKAYLHHQYILLFFLPGYAPIRFFFLFSSFSSISNYVISESVTPENTNLKLSINDIS